MRGESAKEAIDRTILRFIVYSVSIGSAVDNPRVRHACLRLFK